MRRFPIVAMMVAAAVSANCTAPAQEQESKPPMAVPPRKPVPVPSTTPPTEGKLVTAEVPPDLLEKIRADLAQRAGISASAAKVVRAESVAWPDGSMGCAEPGKMYTQATVPGYIVELEHGGRIYAYHASRRGYFQLCEHSKRPASGITE